MCGGDLEITPGSSVATCAYCGSQQTAPNADNEKKNNLYNRANRLRFSNDFDKAAGVFESIVAEFPDEAEAYWGLCLCKYGIEYVDDPLTAKKIPTCHRTAFESIFDDSNYKNAMECAFPEAQSLYHAEAKEIDRLQKAILEIVKNETPYDVFICYKETDENGQRTKDSVQAQDIYTALTDAGYKTFFARITLEDKLGEEFEPYIFSALNSAKVMLVVGTCFENMNATWVKNEWSRYIQIMKSEKGRSLIPCYSDMDAYDMPEEFRNLQAQDMNKVGFIQDLVRGVGKICGGSKSAEKLLRADAQNNHIEIENNLKRAQIAVEDKSWDDAVKFCERVLDFDAENGEAYYLQFMAENKVNSVDEILALKTNFLNDKNFVKAQRYATGVLKNQIESIAARKSETEKASIFLKAQKLEKSLLPWKKKTAYKLYVSLGEYNNVNEKLQSVSKRFKQNCVVFCVIMAVLFGSIGVLGFSSYNERVLKPAKEYEAKKTEYDSACEMLDSGKYDSAKDIFGRLGDFEDSEKKAKLCEMYPAVEEIVFVNSALKAGPVIKEGEKYLEDDAIADETRDALKKVAKKLLDNNKADIALQIYNDINADDSDEDVLEANYQVATKELESTGYIRATEATVSKIKKCAEENYKDSKAIIAKLDSPMATSRPSYIKFDNELWLDFETRNMQAGYYIITWPNGAENTGNFEYAMGKATVWNYYGKSGKASIKLYSNSGQLVGEDTVIIE